MMIRKPRRATAKSPQPFILRGPLRGHLRMTANIYCDWWKRFVANASAAERTQSVSDLDSRGAGHAPAINGGAFDRTVHQSFGGKADKTDHDQRRQHDVG